jgi:hypothetical protein
MINDGMEEREDIKKGIRRKMRTILVNKEDALGWERKPGIMGLNSASGIAACACYSICPVMTSKLVWS